MFHAHVQRSNSGANYVTLSPHIFGQMTRAHVQFMILCFEDDSLGIQGTPIVIWELLFRMARYEQGVRSTSTDRVKYSAPTPVHA